MAEQSFIGGGHRHGGGLDRLARGLSAVMEHAADADAMATRRGLLQGLDPRIKLVGLTALIVSAILVQTLTALAALFAFAVVLALASRVTVGRLARQAWLGVLLFTGFIALPAIFTVPGDALWRVPVLGWTATAGGLRSAVLLTGRAETTATFALLLILTTPWPHVLKALRALGVPVAAVVILGMTHRYVFVLLHTAAEMFEARRSRMVGRLRGRAGRRLIAAGAGALLARSLDLAGEVHLAMISRGYRGEVRLIDDFRTRARDWAALAVALAVPAATLWIRG